MQKIVVIEDEAPFVRLIGWFLVEAGFEVCVVESAAEATDRLRAVDPGLIVCNSGLAENEKRAWFKGWRAMSPDLRVVDLYKSDNMLTQPAQTGADAYLKMPFHADALIDTVRGLLDARDGYARG